MPEKKIKWTEQQWQAIVARGGDVLVTASAGTGKTAVLSGRCVDIVSDKSICPDVWSILVLTFTDMAAEEMRSRIAEQLREAFEESKDSELRRHLRQQLILLQGADISTIHSFCKRLITEYFYKLGLDPTFKVIDADEAKLLKAEVLEKTIDWAWQQSNLQSTIGGLEQLLYRRDLRTNDGFLAKIIELNDFLDGVVSRESWYEKAARLAEIANPFTASLGEKQKQIVADKLRNILAQIRYALKLYASENASGKWAVKWQETFVGPIAKYIELIESGNWEKFSEQIRNHPKPSRYEYKPRELSGLVADIIKSITETAKKSFDKLFDLAILNPNYLDTISGSVGLQTRVLIELVKKFDQLYYQAKRAVNCLDFADLEHHALRLLTAEGSSCDKPLPSETALMLRQRYKHIFIDEYQDINSVQRRILDMLSPSGNIFEVGDVKQSIYAFRGAEPDIFINQLKSASTDYKSAPGGLRVDLNANFRSAKGILDFVNKIFSRIMTESFAKIDYDESARLRPAISTEQGTHGTHVVEFHILDEADISSDLQDDTTQESEGEETFSLVSSRQRQAAMIAQRIKRMVGTETGEAEFQIYDKEIEQYRDIEYRDIVILMRSLAKKANDYVEVLQLAGVPVSCQATAGYFETTEITDMLCLLKVLDNPLRDIELASVLRSSFFNVSDTELTKIKLHGKTTQQHRNFYSHVLEYSNCGTDAKLSGKLKEILIQLEQWRTLARRGNLADLIWQIYRQTHFLAFVSALPCGRARRANLLKLHNRAIQFEGFVTSSGIPSLTRFISFIEKLQEAGQDWVPAEPQSSVGNAVRILSVHKSKGLEFPVVFLAELNSRFNKEDIFADVLADADYTLGLQVIDRKSNSRLNSLAHQVIAEQRIAKLLAEEMRILYVATTRAKDRLILTSCQKRNHCRDFVSNGFFFGEQSIPDWQLRACQNPLDWILFALSDQEVLHKAFETGLTKEAQHDDLFGLKLYSQTELEQFSRYVLQIKSGKLRQFAPPVYHSERSVSGAKNLSKQPKSELFLQIEKSLAWQYDHGDASLLPAKLSVTQLTHRNDEYVKFDYSRVLEKEPRVKHGAKILAGGIISGSRYDNLAVGNATHLLISRLDLSQPVNVEAIQRTKEKLLTDAAITEDVARTIDTDSILAFFQSALGQMALDKANTIWREWPFTFALPLSDFISSSDERRAKSNETVIVQGIIDMLVRTPQGLVIIDFKTDNITVKQVPERAELYRRQLSLYAQAASSILKEKLLAKWLYFLTPATEFEIK